MNKLKHNILKEAVKDIAANSLDKKYLMNNYGWEGYKLWNSLYNQIMYSVHLDKERIN
jgi:hypothetical protein